MISKKKLINALKINISLLLKLKITCIITRTWIGEELDGTN